jgi:hypothetical protein
MSNGNILSTHKDHIISPPSSILPCIASCKCSLIFEEGEPSAVGSHHQHVKWSLKHSLQCYCHMALELELPFYRSLFFAVENTPILIGWLLGNLVLCYFSVMLDMHVPLFARVDILVSSFLDA